MSRWFIVSISAILAVSIANIGRFIDWYNLNCLKILYEIGILQIYIESVCGKTLLLIFVKRGDLEIKF